MSEISTSLQSSSESLLFSFSFCKPGKTDSKKIKKQKKKARKEFCHFNNCFLIKMKWFFSHFGLHRTIELIFQCDRCKKKFICVCIRLKKENN